MATPATPAHVARPLLPRPRPPTAPPTRTAQPTGTHQLTGTRPVARARPGLAGSVFPARPGLSSGQPQRRFRLTGLPSRLPGISVPAGRASVPACPGLQLRLTGRPLWLGWALAPADPDRDPVPPSPRPASSGDATRAGCPRIAPPISNTAPCGPLNLWSDLSCVLSLVSRPERLRSAWPYFR